MMASRLSLNHIALEDLQTYIHEQSQKSYETLPLSVLADSFKEPSNDNPAESSLAYWKQIRVGSKEQYYIAHLSLKSGDEKHPDDERAIVSFTARVMSSAASPQGNLFFQRKGRFPPGMQGASQPVTEAGFKAKLWISITAEEEFREALVTVADSFKATPVFNVVYKGVTKHKDFNSPYDLNSVYTVSHELFYHKRHAWRIATDVPTPTPYPTVQAASSATNGEWLVKPGRPAIIRQEDNDTRPSLTFEGEDRIEYLSPGDIVVIIAHLEGFKGSNGFEISLVPEEIMRVATSDAPRSTVIQTPPSSPSKRKRLATDNAIAESSKSPKLDSYHTSPPSTSRSEQNMDVDHSEAGPSTPTNVRRTRIAKGKAKNASN